MQRKRKRDDFVKTVDIKSLTTAVKEIGQQLQRIEKDLFEIRLDNLRSKGEPINNDRPK